MTIYSIYKATSSTSGKSYIGFTRDFWVRKRLHRTTANQIRSKSYIFKFYKAIRKYGWDDFEWEIIYQSADRDHTLMIESYFIKEYNSFRNGYNSSLGGERGHTDDKIYMLTHSELGIFEGYNFEFRNIYGQGLSDLVSRKALTIQGWKLTSIDGLPFENRKHRKIDHSIYGFKHPTLGEFFGTRIDFCSKFSLRSESVTHVISRKRNSVGKWKLISDTNHLAQA